MKLPKKVIITEVSPRDGLQNEKVFVPTDVKIKLIRLLSDAGFSDIEATAFVNPKKIPMLADHSDVMKQCQFNPKTKYIALIPNLQGLKNAIECGSRHISVITAVSETFAQKNMNCSIHESISRISEIMPVAKKNNMTVRGYISCTLGCPYEGFIATEKTAYIAKKLFDLGCDEVVVADTIGTGTPLIAQQLIVDVNQFVPIEKIGIHFHDTYGQAIANIFACLQLGISKIDSSIGGIGGCPYAKGATGNVATEKVLFLLNGLKIETGIDVEKVMEAKAFITPFL